MFKKPKIDGSIIFACRVAILSLVFLVLIFFAPQQYSLIAFKFVLGVSFTAIIIGIFFVGLLCKPKD